MVENLFRKFFFIFLDLETIWWVIWYAPHVARSLETNFEHRQQIFNFFHLRLTQIHAHRTPVPHLPTNKMYDFIRFQILNIIKLSGLSEHLNTWTKIELCKYFVGFFWSFSIFSSISPQWRMLNECFLK